MREPTRLVLLEGVEGAGKSTIGASLEAKGWGYVHFSYRPEGGLLDFWTTEIRKAAANSDDGRVVIDRMHPSAEVYGYRLRGASDVRERDAEILDEWMLLRGGRIYHLQTVDKEYSAKELKRKYGDKLSVEQVESDFQTYLKKSPVSNLSLFYTANLANDINQLKPR